MKTSIKRLFVFVVLFVLMGAGGLAWYGNRHMQIETLPKTLNVVPGTNLHSLIAMLEREGVVGNAQVFWLLGRILGKAGTLKVGVYTLDRPLTPLELYAMIQRGEVSQAMVQFIEGWNWREVRAALAAQPMLKNESASMSDTEILQAIGAGEDHIEGLLFPDTYYYAPHTSDLSVLRRAYRRPGCRPRPSPCRARQPSRLRSIRPGRMRCTSLRGATAPMYSQARSTRTPAR